MDKGLLFRLKARLVGIISGLEVALFFPPLVAAVPWI